MADSSGPSTIETSGFHAGNPEKVEKLSACRNAWANFARCNTLSDKGLVSTLTLYRSFPPRSFDPTSLPHIFQDYSQGFDAREYSYPVARG